MNRCLIALRDQQLQFKWAPKESTLGGPDLTPEDREQIADIIGHFIATNSFE